MRTILIAVTTAALLAGSLQTAKARPRVYQTFLQQLGEKMEDLSSGGWTSRDLRELRRAMRSRPEGEHPGAYGTFVRLVLKTVSRMAAGGIVSREKDALELLLQANPDPHRTQVSAATYELFIRSFVSMAEELHSGGFMSSERQMLKMVVKATPSRKHPSRIYERTYSAWNKSIQALERKLGTGGLMSAEREVIRLAHSMKPQRVEEKPVIKPTQPSADDDFDDDEYAVSSPSKVRACGRTYRVSWHGRRPQRHRDKATRLLLLKRTTELIELDENSCRERWVSDHVKRVIPVRGTSHFVVLREGGLALMVDDRGDVFRLKRNVTDCRSGRRHHVNLVHRSGREYDVKIEGPAEQGGFPIVIKDRDRLAVRLYRSMWRTVK